jgi:hypothetical protein
MDEKKKDELIWPNGLTTSEMAKQIADSIVAMHNSPEYKAMMKKIRQENKRKTKRKTKKASG